jgi:hypothetical protein
MFTFHPIFFIFFNRRTNVETTAYMKRVLRTKNVADVLLMLVMERCG